MSAALNHEAAARILDLAKPSRSRGAAALAFLLIVALAAHEAAHSGFPAQAPKVGMYSANAPTQAEEFTSMKRLMAMATATALTVSLTAGAGARESVQWRVEDGGNGHWYEFQRATQLICWSDARLLCSDQGGHLATITSGGENQLLRQLTMQNNPGVLEGGPYLGGTCEGLPWGQFYWITGEPFGYTNWLGGAPTGSQGKTEQYMQFWRWENLDWNDQVNCGGLMFSYLIEWSADCNADGLVDYGQIRAGELADANLNNIPDCCEAGISCDCPGDTNLDSAVDGIDLAMILARWGQSAAKFPEADCNSDGLIDGSDLALVLGGWGVCP